MFLNIKNYLPPGLHVTISDEKFKTCVHGDGDGEDVDNTCHNSALLGITIIQNKMFLEMFYNIVLLG